MMVNYRKIFVICVSSTLTFSSLGCGAKELKEEKQIVTEVVEEPTSISEEISNEIVEVQTKEPLEVEMETESSVQEDVTEQDVVDYFEQLEVEINETYEKSGSQVLETLQEKCAHFILFMSNEEEIKGYTWSELTDETKTKIVTIFLRVDEKMTQKYPEYTEKIKQYSKKASAFITDTYQELKGKSSSYIDEKISEEDQKEIKDAFQEGYEDLKDSFDNTKEKIKSWARNKKS